ncbi:MAG: hypothetical protein F4X43_08320, partial [Acidobacteria bacterium]|nr:hypothetical protein [Acidobacteriota bacterium]
MDPAGERVAFLGRRIPGDEPDPEPGAGWDIWLVPAAGGVAERLTQHPGDEGPPVWSPDGTRVAYTLGGGGRPPPGGGGGAGAGGGAGGGGGGAGGGGG